MKALVIRVLHYFAWGAWFVPLGTYLGQTLHCSGVQIGMAYGAVAIGSIVAPFFNGLVVERFLATERVLGVLHLLGAVLMYAASRARTFPGFAVLLLGYALCFMPTLALSTTVSVDYEPKAESTPARVAGLVGWIVAGLVVGYGHVEATAVPLQLAALVSLVLGVLAFQLPRVESEEEEEEEQATFTEDLEFDADTLALLRDRSFATVMIAMGLLSVAMQFYAAFTNPFLHEIGLAEPAATMSLAQVSELVGLVLMALSLMFLGVKRTLLIGVAGWALRYTCFAAGTPWTLYAGILLHGICYNFFFLAGQMFVNASVDPAYWAAAQGVLVSLTEAIGLLVGAMVSGRVVDAYHLGDGHDWQAIWLVPAGIAYIVFVGVAIGFGQAREFDEETSRIVSESF